MIFNSTMKVGKSQEVIMQDITVGQRVALNAIDINDQLDITIEFNRKSSIAIDISCFALDAKGKLVNDDYMVFYNQRESPCQAIKLNYYDDEVSNNSKKQAVFSLNLQKLPSNIDSLFFVMSADTQLSAVETVEASVNQGRQKAKLSFKSVDFSQNQASMLMQLYKKSGLWRLTSVAQGFNGGLAAIVQHFGGDIGEAEPINNNQKVNTVKPSLEKIMLEKAPKLVNLAKKATISLEKKNLGQVTARVALVLDASGSMNGQYRKGRVQEVVDRLLPLAVNFDDNQALDCWAFGAKAKSLGEINLSNYSDFINKVQGGWQKWDLGSRVNNESAAIDQVVDFYKDSNDKTPVYVLFISDGGVHDNSGITKRITEAAKLPIFWEFVGLGGSSYGILKKLDDMSGRIIDNCDFFEVDDLHDMSEEQLYDNMLEEFPAWLKEAKRLGLI